MEYQVLPTTSQLMVFNKILIMMVPTMLTQTKQLLEVSEQQQQVVTLMMDVI